LKAQVVQNQPHNRKAAIIFTQSAQSGKTRAVRTALASFIRPWFDFFAASPARWLTVTFLLALTLRMIVVAASFLLCVWF